MTRFVALLWCLLAAPNGAGAHGLAPSLLELEEQAPGRVAMHWRTPLQAGTQRALRPAPPSDCTPLGPSQRNADSVRLGERLLLHCTRPSLVGARVGVEGLAETSTNVLLRVSLADGRQLRALLSAREPRFEVPPRTERIAVAASFFGLGVEHLATGLDHLLFVTGLVCLLRRGRSLLGAITAFTAGHSVTLALAVLGVVRLPSGLVEIGIAGSLVWLALEIARAREGVASGLLSRRPWLMALGFGLLHGLGFAGALREAGLPQEEIPLALFAFNLGIEAGQLGLVALLLLAARTLRPAPLRWRALAPRLAAEAIGVLGVFFSLERLGVLLGRP